MIVNDVTAAAAVVKPKKVMPIVDAENIEQQPTVVPVKSKKSKKQKEKKILKEEGSVVVAVESVDSSKEKIVIDLAKAINKTKDSKEKKYKSDKKKAAAANSDKERDFKVFCCFDLDFHVNFDFFLLSFKLDCWVFLC